MRPAKSQRAQDGVAKVAPSVRRASRQPDAATDAPMLLLVVHGSREHDGVRVNIHLQQ